MMIPQQSNHITEDINKIITKTVTEKCEGNNIEKHGIKYKGKNNNSILL